jgi:uncharacterized protein YhhL (DUF1145 family)
MGLELVLERGALRNHNSNKKMITITILVFTIVTMITIKKCSTA